MNKLAIFVEGQTEQLLIIKMIKEIASQKKVSILKEKASGGSKKGSRNFVIIDAESISKDVQYFILVIDCGNDSKVKSDILERYDSLRLQGYKKIIGIRDVYPDMIHSEVSKLRANLNKALPKDPSIISFILGVMEIEAWLLAEYTHFSKIDSRLTPERIKRELGIDLINDDLSQRPCPSKDLSDIYWLEKLNYDKGYGVVSEILSVLDYSHLKKTISSKFFDLKTLYDELKVFFASEPMNCPMLETLK